MLITVGSLSPRVNESAWIAPGAVLAGDVGLAEGASVWYGAVVRGDGDRISIGAHSNIQDGCVLHTDPGFHLSVGRHVTVGHRAVLHGCHIEDEVLIGMGAIVMNGALVGTGSMVAAGALIPAGDVIPPYSLVVGSPGKVRRDTTTDERALIRANAEHYVALARQHRTATD